MRGGEDERGRDRETERGTERERERKKERERVRETLRYSVRDHHAFRVTYMITKNDHRLPSVSSLKSQ